MAIDYTMTLTFVSVINEQDSLNDIVKKVIWEMRFFDTDHPTITSVATVETYLDTDSLAADSFTPFANLTHTQILQWAYDREGGDTFKDHLLDIHHRNYLDKLIADASYTEKDIDLIPEA